MNRNELNRILEKHRKWLLNEDGGECANLHCANLSCADLRCANLSDANLSCADLSCADLRGANLSGANLCGANLCGANLRDANLRCANLHCANLCCANLCCADLRGANLYCANLCDANLHCANLCGARDFYLPLSCPDTGSFVGWKKAVSASKQEYVIVKLEIAEDAKRSSATGRKCRCDKAKVVEIQDMDGNVLDGETAVSSRDRTFKYIPGAAVTSNFDDDRWNECSTGIHFFTNREEAVNYCL